MGRERLRWFIQLSLDQPDSPKDTRSPRMPPATSISPVIQTRLQQTSRQQVLSKQLLVAALLMRSWPSSIQISPAPLRESTLLMSAVVARISVVAQPPEAAKQSRSIQRAM